MDRKLQHEATVLGAAIGLNLRESGSDRIRKTRPSSNIHPTVAMVLGAS